MAGYDNIKDHGFDKKTADERRELAVLAGKKSGEARRKKANFRKTLNALLTTEIDSPEWKSLLESLGLDCTLEAALNMAMIKEGLAGNVKAYVAVRDTIGQTIKSDEEIERQKIEIEKLKIENERLSRQLNGAKEEYESDGFLEALKNSAEDFLKGAEEFIET